MKEWKYWSPLAIDGSSHWHQSFPIQNCTHNSDMHHPALLHAKAIITCVDWTFDELHEEYLPTKLQVLHPAPATRARKHKPSKLNPGPQALNPTSQPKILILHQKLPKEVQKHPGGKFILQAAGGPVDGWCLGCTGMSGLGFNGLGFQGLGLRVWDLRRERVPFSRDRLQCVHGCREALQSHLALHAHCMYWCILTGVCACAYGAFRLLFIWTKMSCTCMR